MIDVTVLIDTRMRSQAPAIIEKLKAAGLTEVEVRERFGIVHGLIPGDAIGALREIEGVASATPTRTMKTQ